MKLLLPPGWPEPRGYSEGLLAKGQLIFVAGQIGWDTNHRVVSSDFTAQAKQALRNIVQILAEGGAEPNTIARLTWFVKDKREYLASLKEVGAAYRDVIGNHYPAMSLVQVADLLEEEAKVEIEATAVLPW